MTRPVGALVLTQVCGAYGALAAETLSSASRPACTAATAVNSSTVAAPTTGGTAPTTGALPGGPADAVRNQYPYPVNPDGTSNATYPTHCGINLGNAQFVRSGAGAGQFFAAEGRLNQVTVVDTRDGDLGWNVVGQVSNFTAGPGKSFSGSPARLGPGQDRGHRRVHRLARQHLRPGDRRRCGDRPEHRCGLRPQQQPDPHQRCPVRHRLRCLEHRRPRHGHR